MKGVRRNLADSHWQGPVNFVTATMFKILFQNESLVAIDKPAGFHVHPPEDRSFKVPRDRIVLHQLRDQIGQRLFPVHRIDVSTSGVLLFALDSRAARVVCENWSAANRISKTYWAVVRGYVPQHGEIALPLESDSTGQLMPARTVFRSRERLELPYAIGSRHATARYSWLEVQPMTGRFHQIRRHFNRIAHPVVGCGTHGDSRHNRFFREKLGIAGLCLRATEVRIQLPELDWNFTISAGFDEKWQRIEALFKGKFPRSSPQPTEFVVNSYGR
jgi:tRNA pseudouridine65 synthase